ncbi:hypothetical protein sortregn_49 [Escherichia phage sortregn]|nr:hypothetical protein sortregn_49 [Escherichia phage sortregn]
MTDFLERVRIEKADLEGKITALSQFIFNSPGFAKVNPTEQRLLVVQLDVMKAYAGVLQARLDLPR